MRYAIARTAAYGLAALALLPLAPSRRSAAQTATAQAAPPQRSSARTAPQPANRDSLAAALSALRGSPDAATIPAADRFSFGDSTIAAGRSVAGPVAVAFGTLHVRGVVDGDAVVYHGDIVVHSGGEVRGGAFAMLGKVILDGGRIDGETRTLDGDLSRVGAVAEPSAASATLHGLALAGGWLAVLFVVGIGVLLFASTNLDAVSETLGRSFGRSLLAGIAAQLAFAPLLVVVCVALCLTILGVLLVPFAIVAYILAAAGLVTLGYLAVARVIGRTVLGNDPRPNERARRIAALRGVLYGLILLMVPWLAAGALAWSPQLELVARLAAFAVTWVAATAGLGAAVVSRGGVRRASAGAAQRAMSAASWSTPTPVSGVTASRRPTPLSTPAAK